MGLQHPYRTPAIRRWPSRLEEILDAKSGTPSAQAVIKRAAPRLRSSMEPWLTNTVSSPGPATITFQCACALRPTGIAQSGETRKFS